MSYFIFRKNLETKQSVLSTVRLRLPRSAWLSPSWPMGAKKEVFIVSVFGERLKLRAFGNVRALVLLSVLAKGFSL